MLKYLEMVVLEKFVYWAISLKVMFFFVMAKVLLMVLMDRKVTGQGLAGLIFYGSGQYSGKSYYNRIENGRQLKNKRLRYR